MNVKYTAFGAHGVSYHWDGPIVRRQAVLAMGVVKAANDTEEFYRSLDLDRRIRRHLTNRTERE